MSHERHPPGPTSRTSVAGFALAALVGVTYFAVAVIALHVLNSDVDPVRSTTSFYAHGTWAPLMSSAFLAMSIATFALVAGLGRSMAASTGARIGLAPLALWGVGTLVAMMFPIGLEDAGPSLSNTVHRINGPLAFLALSTGALLVSRGFARVERWRPIAWPALALSVLMASGFVGLTVSLATGGTYSGLLQRVVLAAVVAWFVLTALRLRSGVPARIEHREG